MVRKIIPQVQTGETEISTWEQELLTNEFVQIYPRVSTPEQMKNVSAEMQQDKTFALRCGWSESLIIIDTADLGLSGQLRMEDRTAFNTMNRRIAERVVKTIIVSQVDRLFRDRWGQEYSKFVEICYTYSVKVVTLKPDRKAIDFIYDFSIPWHVEKFRQKCEEAWNYVKNHLATMHAAQRELGEAGYWVVGNLPIGYIVDRQQKYRKYIPYKTHATVVAWLFKRFQQLAGQINELFREIDALEVLFLPFEEEIGQEIVSRFRLKKVLSEEGKIKGYKLASTLGLRNILSNPAYVGYWVYKSRVICSGNHEAIIDFGTFIYAFNRLSPTNLDGTPNQSYLERRNLYIKKHKAERPALLINKVTTDVEGYTVYVKEVPLIKSTEVEAFYGFYPKVSGIRGAKYMLRASEVDKFFLDCFVTRLQEPDDFENFLEQEKAERQEQMPLRMDIERDINATRAAMERLERQAKTGQLTVPALAKAANEAYEKLAEELERLERRLKDITTNTTQARQRQTYKELMREAGEAWKEIILLEEITLMVDLFVKRAVLTNLSPRFYKLAIYWHDPTWEADEMICFRSGNPAMHWSSEEDAILLEHFPKSSRELLLRLLPTRSYQAMRARAYDIGMRRPNSILEDVPHSFCWLDMQIMEQYGVTEKELRMVKGAKLLTRRH